MQKHLTTGYSWQRRVSCEMSQNKRYSTRTLTCCLCLLVEFRFQLRKTWLVLSPRGMNSTSKPSVPFNIEDILVECQLLACRHSELSSDQVWTCPIVGTGIPAWWGPGADQDLGKGSQVTCYRPMASCLRSHGETPLCGQTDRITDRHNDKLT